MTRPAPTLPRPLVVRLCNQVGDVVLSVPALRLLEQQGHALQLVGKGWAGALLAGHGWPCQPHPPKLSAKVRALRDLRRRLALNDPGFERRPNALVMPNSFSSALDMRLAGLRPCGYARDGRGWLLTRREHEDGRPHELEDHWQLACSFTGTQAAPPRDIGLLVHPTAQQRADELIRERGIRAGFIVLVPFAAGVVDKQEKKWPAFAQLTQALAGCGRDLVICPGPNEEGIARQEHPQALCLPGLDLGVYAGLLRRAALVVSNDTGPAHLAAAVDAPVLSVLGPTKAGQWAPWGSRVRIVSRHPDWPTLEAVQAEALRMLAEPLHPGAAAR